MGWVIVAVATFRRSSRREPPPLIVHRIEVRQPPAAAPRRHRAITRLLPAVAALAGLTAIVLAVTAGGIGGQVAAGAVFGLALLAVAGDRLARLDAGRSRGITEDRRDYLRHLAQVRRQASAAVANQAEALFWLHPDPAGLPSLIRTSRLWERRPVDSDFGTLRIGVRDQPPALDLQLVGVAPEDVDVESAVALHRLLGAHGASRTLPVALSLRAFSTIRPEGDRAASRRLATAMVLQAISWHAPTDFRLALCADRDGLAAWDWLKWTPHLADPGVPSTELPRFTVADNVAAVEKLLAAELAGRPRAEAGADQLPDWPQLLVIVDGGLDGGTLDGGLVDSGLVDSGIVDGGMVDGGMVDGGLVDGGLRDGGRGDGGGGGRPVRALGLAGVTILELPGLLDVSNAPGGPRPLPDLPQGARELRLRVTTSNILRVTVDRFGQESLTPLGRPDQIGPAEAAATSRAIAAFRMPENADRVVDLERWTPGPSDVGRVGVSGTGPDVSSLPPADRVPADDLLRDFGSPPGDLGWVHPQAFRLTYAPAATARSAGG